MKKILAIVLVVVMVASSGVVAFAADKFAFQFRDISDYDFLNNVFSQFDFGDGNYIIPIDNRSVLDDLNSCFNSDSWIPYFDFCANSSLCYFSIYFVPKSNTYFIQSGSDYVFRYKNYVPNYYRVCRIDFDSSLGYFHTSSTIYPTAQASSFASFYPVDAKETYGDLSVSYFPDDFLFSFISDTYISKMPYLYFLSDISSISFVYKDDYVPPAPSTYTLTINYLYSENNHAANSMTQEIAPGTEYSIPSPEIEGYTPSIPIVTGTMPNEDLTIDVYYSKAFYNLTVQYKFQDGSKAAEDIVYQYPADFSYDIQSPVLEGHTPDKLSVIGTMPSNSLTEVVTYTPNHYTLRVDYLHTDGSRAAESSLQDVSFGSSYSVSSPQVTGYVPDQATVSGIMPGHNVVHTVTYQPDSGGGSSGGGSPDPDDGGGTGGGGEYGGDDPFNVPDIPGFSGNDPFKIPGLPEYSSSDPFQIRIPSYSSDPFKIQSPGNSMYDPFKIPGLPDYSYDPFVMPDIWKKED